MGAGGGEVARRLHTRAPRKVVAPFMLVVDSTLGLVHLELLARICLI